MSTPENFEVAEGYACYRPNRQCSFQEAVELACTAIAFARDNRITRLLIDTTKLTGFERPNTSQRFHLGERTAETAMSLVKVAVVANPEMIDARRFGATVARNRGLITEPFVSEADALAWLLDSQAK